MKLKIFGENCEEKVLLKVVVVDDVPFILV